MSNTPEKIPLEQQQQQPPANPLYPTLNQEAANPLLPPQATPAYPAAPMATGPPPPPGYMPVPQMTGMPIMTQPGMPPMQPVLGQQQKRNAQDYFTSCVSVDRLCVSDEPAGEGRDREEGKRKKYQTRRLVVVVWHVVEKKLANCGRFMRSVRFGKRSAKERKQRTEEELCDVDDRQHRDFERLLTDEERRCFREGIMIWEGDSIFLFPRNRMLMLAPCALCSYVLFTASWMPMPQGIPNCPPGLEYLTAVDQLLVHQKVELLEAFTGFETANKYTVKNVFGQNVYWAVEDTSCCTRMCCGPDRPFDIKILDNYQNEVLHLHRDLRCKSCCFPCCLQKLEVSAPPGNVIGTVVQKWSLCRPVFDIRDRNNKTVLTIRGPVCQCSPCGDVKFSVFSNDGTEVGKVTKQWTGFVQEHFTDADNFGINFPMDLDVRVKATMLGALFLIDYMYFESGDNKKIRR
uniref:Uncharacterized protein n=1 Tax=Anopheles stephensi TaxID=30069 RepID=A0A182Y0X0_ANOST